MLASVLVLSKAALVNLKTHYQPLFTIAPPMGALAEGRECERAPARDRPRLALLSVPGRLGKIPMDSSILSYNRVGYPVGAETCGFRLAEKPGPVYANLSTTSPARACKRPPARVLPGSAAEPDTLVVAHE